MPGPVRLAQGGFRGNRSDNTPSAGSCCPVDPGVDELPRVEHIGAHIDLGDRSLRGRGILMLDDGLEPAVRVAGNPP